MNSYKLTTVETQSIASLLLVVTVHAQEKKSYALKGQRKKFLLRIFVTNIHHNRSRVFKFRILKQ
jgi:hypothetical protein